MEYFGTRAFIGEEEIPTSTPRSEGNLHGLVSLAAMLALAEAFFLQAFAADTTTETQKFVILGTFPAIELFGSYMFGSYVWKDAHARFKMWVEFAQAALFVWLCDSIPVALIALPVIGLVQALLLSWGVAGKAPDEKDLGFGLTMLTFAVLVSIVPIVCEDVESENAFGLSTLEDRFGATNIDYIFKLLRAPNFAYYQITLLWAVEYLDVVPDAAKGFLFVNILVVAIVFISAVPSFNWSLIDQIHGHPYRGAFIEFSLPTPSLPPAPPPPPPPPSSPEAHHNFLVWLVWDLLIASIFWGTIQVFWGILLFIFGLIWNIIWGVLMFVKVIFFDGLFMSVASSLNPIHGCDPFQSILGWILHNFLLTCICAFALGSERTDDQLGKDFLINMSLGSAAGGAAYFLLLFIYTIGFDFLWLHFFGPPVELLWKIAEFIWR